MYFNPVVLKLGCIIEVFWELLKISVSLYPIYAESIMTTISKVGHSQRFLKPPRGFQGTANTENK